MLTLIFSIILFWAVWKIAILGIRFTWGIFKFIFSVVLFPIVLIGIFVAGLAYVAIPIAIVVGLIALITGKTATAV
ncbi:MAG: hypothetical protein K6F54_04215 [Lachnospiraceae bacterium]|nr:hypothetical protein [Lachnospiraceae bacterium]